MFTGAALGGMLDLGGASKLLSRLVSHLLERELRIDGDLELRLGPRPRIAARDIVLANSSWAGGDLLRIEQLELELDLSSLWRRPLRIEYLRIAGARLDLIEREDGSTNWAFAEVTDTPADPPGLELPPLISDGLVSDSLVRYLRPDLNSPAELHIDRLANYLDAGDTLQLDLQGSIGELPLRVSGQAGAYSAMLSGNNMIFDLQLALGRYRLAMDGALGDLARLEGLQMNGQLTGPDSTAFYEAPNFSQTDAGPIDLSASINDLATGLSWSVLGQFGSLTVDIDGSVKVPLELDGLDSTVAIAGNNLDLVAGWLGIHTCLRNPSNWQGASTARDGTCSCGM